MPLAQPRDPRSRVYVDIPPYPPPAAASASASDAFHPGQWDPVPPASGSDDPSPRRRNAVLDSLSAAFVSQPPPSSAAGSPSARRARASSLTPRSPGAQPRSNTAKRTYTIRRVDAQWMRELGFTPVFGTRFFKCPPAEACARCRNIGRACEIPLFRIGKGPAHLQRYACTACPGKCSGSRIRYMKSRILRRIGPEDSGDENGNGDGDDLESEEGSPRSRSAIHSHSSQVAGQVASQITFATQVTVASQAGPSRPPAPRSPATRPPSSPALKSALRPPSSPVYVQEYESLPDMPPPATPPRPKAHSFTASPSLPEVISAHTDMQIAARRVADIEVEIVRMNQQLAKAMEEYNAAGLKLSAAAQAGWQGVPILNRLVYAQTLHTWKNRLKAADVEGEDDTEDE